jgi:hypothetical protein
MFIKHGTILLLMFMVIQANAQTTDTHDGHSHVDHHSSHDDHEHHDHHKNELGVANAPVYFVKEKVLTYGLHLHYVRTILNSKFGIGLGYERIFDAHKHNTVGLLATYRPIDKLNVNISPGITFEGIEAVQINFALHIEAAYEFEIHDFHLGPVLEFAYDPEDYHISLGLHIGYGF